MQLHISNTLLDRLVEIERTIALFPKTLDHKAFYLKRIKDNKLEEIVILGKSMEHSLSNEDAKEIQKKADQGIIQQHFRLLKNSLDVMRFARSVRMGTFNATVLQQENKLLSNGFSDFWEEGKVRAPHERPTYLHDGLRQRVQSPVYDLWTDIRQELTHPSADFHPIILASSVVYHLVYSYPFLQFSLQTALLAAYTIFRPSRYWMGGILTILPAIWNTLQRTDFSHDPTPEGHLLFTERVATEFRAQVVSILDTLEHQATIAPQIRASLNDRQLRILTYFKQHKKVTRKKYSTMMDVAIATSFRDLNDLYQKGLIKPTGKGRGVGYILAKLPTLDETEQPVDKEEVLGDPFAQAAVAPKTIDDDLFVE